MGKYILKRLVMTIFVIVGAAVLIFSIMYFVPGEPVTILLGTEATAEEIAAKRAQLGLNDPYLIRLGRFLSDAFLHFDLGTSWFKNSSVAGDLLSRLPRTLFLGTMFVIISSVISIPLGITAAIHQNGWQDRLCMVIAMICTSVPDFWLALMMVYLFSLKLGWLPSFGIESWQCYIMPIIAGSLHGIGQLARQTRSSMLDVCRADFVTTARAKGIPEKKVIYSHMLPNALIPVITIIGGSFGRSIAGTIVIEQIFSMPGIGTYISTAISSRDYPVVQGSVIILAAFIAVVMLLVDLVYAYVDPRIKAQYIAQSKRRNKHV
ncbi:MAG: ABC transporter permease [Lachnospiraceae bacterium]|jgi:ABC-type dipeptide/oligopeptide/nickel transport system permease component